LTEALNSNPLDVFILPDADFVAISSESALGGAANLKPLVVSEVLVVSPSVDAVVDDDNFGSAGEPKWNPPDAVAPLVAIFVVADGEFTFAGAPNVKPPLAVVLLDADGADVPN